jgi:hypothetical protein
MPVNLSAMSMGDAKNRAPTSQKRFRHCEPRRGEAIQEMATVMNSKFINKQKINKR